MSCIIKYKGQSIPEEQFLQYLNKQIAINNLFNENVSFANSVYEALGFNNYNGISIKLGRSVERDFGKVQNVIISYNSVPITSQDGISGLGEMNVVIKDNEIVVGNIRLPEEYQGKGLTKYIYQAVADAIGLPIVNSKSKGFNQSESGGYIWKNRSSFQPNVQQKQQAQQQYSQYLDTIFPDSRVAEIDNSLYNSVLNQLEQENIIEKDCSGGKLKAKDGLRTKFTKGSQWEIVKDLKGYPSHAQGGVDIKLGKNGFSFTRGSGQIIAAHGLVLSNNFGNPIEFEAMSKVLSQRNKHLNWVDRGLNPDNYPKIDNQDGTFSTHRLAYRTGDNGEAYIYPTIIQNDKGELEELDDDAAWEYARNTKTAMVVPNVKLAEYYSQNGLIKH